MTSLQKNQSLSLAVIGVLVVVLLYVGCGSADDVPTIEPEPIAGANGASSAFGEYGTAYFGLISMEELVLRSEAIARVRFNSVEQGIERMRYVYPSGNHLDLYAGSLVITFDVLEYLKGRGGNQVEAVLFDGDRRKGTEGEVRAAGEDFLAFRDKQWDDREAIVFLQSGPLIPSTLQDSDRYYMTWLRANGEHGYTVDSRWAKAWLPDAAPPSSSGQTTGTSSDEQRFLTNVPGGGSGGSGQFNGQLESITLGELKTMIANLEAQVTAGGGTKAYRDCLIGKYRWARTVEDRKADLAVEGREYKQQFPRQLASGSPAGSEVYEGGNFLILKEATKANEPTWSDVAVVKTGRDAALFAHKWPLIATTTRPLPEGAYRFYWAEQSRYDALCDAMPGDHRTRNEVVVTVTAPANTLHEAFFDPVTMGSGVGADGTNGTLSPTAFTIGGSAAALHSLKWESGSLTLTLTLSPYASLSGLALDFIALDGTTALSLAASDATVDSTAGTLSWTVASKPWNDGDQLMLRIRLLPCTDGVAVPNPSDNPGLVGDCQTLLEALPTLLGPDDAPVLLWNDGKAMDSWHGVRMSGSPKRVSRLELAYKGMRGTLPAGLGALDALTRIDMRGNKLTGSIPTELGKLTNLEYLNLSGNKLSGTIPVELGSLVNLERLLLHKNGLTGVIPAELGDLTALHRFYLSDNELTGDIPAVLGDLTQLTHVYILANNQLTGCVPGAWEDISKSADPTEHGLTYCAAE